MRRQHKTRFIAGACCPKCGELDSLQLERQDGVSQIRCVQCEHVETQASEPVAQATRNTEQLIGVFQPN